MSSQWQFSYDFPKHPWCSLPHSPSLITLPSLSPVKLPPPGSSPSLVTALCSTLPLPEAPPLPLSLSVFLVSSIPSGDILKSKDSKLRFTNKWENVVFVFLDLGYFTQYIVQFHPFAWKFHGFKDVIWKKEYYTMRFFYYISNNIFALVRESIH